MPICRFGKARPLSDGKEHFATDFHLGICFPNVEPSQDFDHMHEQNCFNHSALFVMCCFILLFIHTARHACKASQLPVSFVVNQVVAIDAAPHRETAYFVDRIDGRCAKLLNAMFDDMLNKTRVPYPRVQTGFPLYNGGIPMLFPWPVKPGKNVKTFPPNFSRVSQGSRSLESR